MITLADIQATGLPIALAQAMPMFAGGIEALLNLAVVPDPVTPLEVARSIEQGV